MAAHQKFGTQAETPISIIIFRNGDVHDKGKKVTLKKTIKTMDQLYQIATQEVQLVTGACRKLVTKDGTQIKNLTDFTEGLKVVALAGEPLNKEKMPKAL
ncbi:MAG: hypothetical protein EZS28_006361 [Streblomastix strix]|uniref:Doublecortin domain-containing protein n=1 Tax=Streblomastix strix TaxID=222440 RepID=A0A5J4WSU1_9EUKA|nr:MAG: hypothetical protein EZS28_006361 [Streblomastix strix]